jgi:hypothetical protein
LTLGFPVPSIEGFNPKLTDGIISSLTGLRDDPDDIQITTPVQPGNSGGAWRHLHTSPMPTTVHDNEKQPLEMDLFGPNHPNLNSIAMPRTV